MQTPRGHAHASGKLPPPLAPIVLAPGGLGEARRGFRQAPGGLRGAPGSPREPPGGPQLKPYECIGFGAMDVTKHLNI